MRRTAIVLGLVLAGLAAGTAQAAPATFVHGLSPYPNPGGCHGAPQSGTLFVNSEVEPWVGDDGSLSGRPDSLIGTWQQDRFSSGGASGLLVAYSHNGGLSWMVPPLADQPKISNCQDPDNTRDELRLGAGDRSLERHLAERRHVVHEPVVQRHAQPAQRDAGQQVRGRRRQPGPSR